jgi:hypothetical protein
MAGTQQRRRGSGGGIGAAAASGRQQRRQGRRGSGGGVGEAKAMGGTQQRRRGSGGGIGAAAATAGLRRQGSSSDVRAASEAAARGAAHCVGTATATLGMAAGEGGDGRCDTEWRGPAHAIARVTGVRGSDGRNSDARTTVTPIDCLRVGAGTSLEGDAGGERETRK